MSFQRFTVLGAGAWGCALANAAKRAGRSVILWGRAPHPQTKLEAGIEVTADLARALSKTEAVLAVVPAQALREVMVAADEYVPSGTPIVSCAKGIERGRHKFTTEIIGECVQTALPAILSGPSFAADVSRGLPTAVTLAARDLGVAERLAQALGSATFRPYHTTDVRGVEIGGAAKNVFAIGAGIVSGRGLGASAAAALTTRGFAELLRFGAAYNARPETLTGLSGLGDLVLSCSTPQSRNFSLGIALGKGERPQEASHGQLAEGAFTAQALVEMARVRKVDMPVAEAVTAVIEGKLAVDQAVESLMTRPFRAEV
jgi:glycerol-3-phosphate dehydrogenase (NAD(P)+)